MRRSENEVPSDVLLHVFVARFPNVRSDVVVTFNQPLDHREAVQDR